MPDVTFPLLFSTERWMTVARSVSGIHHGIPSGPSSKAEENMRPDDEEDAPGADAQIEAPRRSLRHLTPLGVSLSLSVSPFVFLSPSCVYCSRSLYVPLIPPSRVPLSQAHLCVANKWLPVSRFPQKVRIAPRRSCI